MSESCCGHQILSKPFYKKSLFLLSFFLFVGLIFSFVFPAWLPFRTTTIHYFKIMLIPILIGLLFGGLIDYFIPREYISKMFAKNHYSTILYALGLGFLMSACNHGILALSMALYKKGASGPAVITFLLASPWANLPITILLVGFFGWKGLLIIALSLVVALVTGFLFLVLQKKNLIEENPNTLSMDADFSIVKDLKKRWENYQFKAGNFKSDLKGIWKSILELSDMILPWIIFGVMLAALFSTFVPHDFFKSYLGPSLLGLFITLIAATILEICSEGTSPLAFELYRQTGAFGNAFVFLMAGVVTDYTEIGLVWKNIGRRTALWMIALSLPQVLTLGWILNHF